MTRKKEFRAKQLLYRKMFKMTCLMARPYSTFKHVSDLRIQLYKKWLFEVK